MGSRIQRGLGADYDLPSISVSPDGSHFTMSAPAPLLEPINVFVSVDGATPTPQVQGRQDDSYPNWILAGHVYTWTMYDGNGNLLLTYTADTRSGFPLTARSVLTSAAVSSPGATSTFPVAPAASGGGSSAAPIASWFSGTTNLMGTNIPNAYLAVAGALLLVVALKKKG